jgi:RTX calcium-binding nonapeptide repeat (4 copies)
VQEFASIPFASPRDHGPRSPDILQGTAGRHSVLPPPTPVYACRPRAVNNYNLAKSAGVAHTSRAAAHAHCGPQAAQAARGSAGRGRKAWRQPCVILGALPKTDRAGVPGEGFALRPAADVVVARAAGRDTLTGEAGDDYLDPGNDGTKDSMTGGAGADTFVRYYAQERWGRVYEDSITNLFTLLDGNQDIHVRTN